jgi:predicted dehydrogenase
MAIDAAHFVDCIDNDVEPDLNAAAAAGIAETILAGYESAARGEEVSLPLPRD